jgi:hypothetical protein
LAGTAALLASIATPSAMAEDVAVFNIHGVAGIAGKNYEPEETSNPVDLEGTRLVVEIGRGWQCEETEDLPSGQTYTLISTTGGLTGAFVGTPDGAEISTSNWQIVVGPCKSEIWSRIRFRINYEESGPVQTVTATVVNGSPVPVSDVRVSGTARSPKVINQVAALTAEIESSSGTPSGIVSFAQEGPIPECQGEPITRAYKSFVAHCETFLVASRRAGCGFHWGGEIAARFVPAPETELLGTTGYTIICAEPTATSTAVAASDPAPLPGTVVTYRATVTPALLGRKVPSGVVRFDDDGNHIGGCEEQPLAPEGQTATAECTVEYRDIGTHTITAAALLEEKYFGDSISPPLQVFVTSAVQGAPIPSPQPTLIPPMEPLVAELTGQPSRPRAKASPPKCVVPRVKGELLASAAITSRSPLRARDGERATRAAPTGGRAPERCSGSEAGARGTDRRDARRKADARAPQANLTEASAAP